MQQRGDRRNLFRREGRLIKAIRKHQTMLLNTRLCLESPTYTGQYKELSWHVLSGIELIISFHTGNELTHIKAVMLFS